MTDIKTKQKVQNKIPIKKIDRRKLYAKKLKDNIIEIKQYNKMQVEDDENSSANEYGINQLEEKANIIVNKGKANFQRYGKKSVIETKENIKIATQKIKQNIENRTTKNIIKNANKGIKTVKQTEKIAYKATKQTTKVAVKSTKKAYQITKNTTKATIKGMKVGIRATITTLKAIITSTKALISVIIAGGWIAIIIIIAICLIIFMCSAMLGISSENSNIVKVASSQIGNIGGQPYWSWYGFSSRVEWCACFVSWCAEQCGYIDNGIIPKFSSCQNEGIPYFKEKRIMARKRLYCKIWGHYFF